MSENSKAIDDYIRGLDYNLSDLLVFDGTSVENPPKRPDASFDGTDYIVVTREKHSASGNLDLSVPAANRSISYPGALVCINQDLLDGMPQAVSGDRGSVNLTLDLPGMTSGNTVVVEEATYGNVSAAANQILDNWYKNYQEECIIPAEMSYEASLIHDESELKVKFGLNIGEKIGIDFGDTSTRKKSTFVAKYSQIFYVASVDQFGMPSDAFADTVTLEDLISFGLDNTNPPGYVGAVVYGREVYLTFQSDVSENLLEAAMKAKISSKGISADVDAKYKDVYSNTTFSMVILGGNAGSYSGVLDDEEAIKSIQKLIFSQTQLSRDNPAYPIAYKVSCLNNNDIAKINASTDYITETYTRYSSGLMTIKHTGAFVARFDINWKVVTGYDDDGNEELESNNNTKWGDNGKHKTAGFYTEICLPGNAREISVKIEDATGLVWDPWMVAYCRDSLPIVPVRDFKVSGTTLNPRVHVYLQDGSEEE